MTDRVVSVALPLPLQSPFEYRVPDGQEVPLRGCRVVVPFGPRRLVGVVTRRRSSQPAKAESLKDVVSCIDVQPLCSDALLDLAEFVSDHYLAPLGECYRLTMPPQGMAGSRTTVRLAEAIDPADDPILGAVAKQPVPLGTLLKRFGRQAESVLWRRRAEGAVLFEQRLAGGPRALEAAIAVLVNVEEHPRGSAQVAVVEGLRRAGGRLRVSELVGDRASMRGAVNRLAEKGVIALESERLLRSPSAPDGAPEAPASPSAEQASVLRSLEAALDDSRYAAYLLHGVTGSGKTEVYFRAARRALEAGRGAILLVPEIALTPFLVRAARARFGDDVAVLHSELSLGERYDQWWMIRDGRCRVVIGARSAVFAPLAQPGLIAVDEEHEGAYKQEESPRYNGRDLAVVRARLEGAVVVLGSATPAAESFDNALRGKYTLLEMPTRVGASGLPRVEIVDRRAAARAGDDALLTAPLQRAIAERLRRREQVLVLLNRRGFATSLLCRECGSQAVCRHCSVFLAVHYGGTRVLCHYCGFESAAPESCESCRGSYLRLSGCGTEQIAKRVAECFPSARVSRLDRDVASKRGELARVLSAFEAGEIDILVGTQMIAKGHDFPRVTLVGVIDADVGLGLPDFRAAERTFQLLTQVAGRAGRQDLPGEVIVQSHLPDHYALAFACAQDYRGFFGREMEYRRTLSYPPRAAMINVIFRAREASEGESAATAVARSLRGEARGRFMVLGPARAPLARLRDEHRFQVLLKGSRAEMREAVRRALVARFGAMRWPGVVVDVDPTSVM